MSTASSRVNLSQVDTIQGIDSTKHESAFPKKFKYEPKYVLEGPK